MKSKKAYLAATAVLLGGMWMSVSTVHAKINIEPVIITSYGYDSNFWKAEDDETAVGTVQIRPGVRTKYDTGKTIINFDAFLEAYMYHDYDTPPVGVQDADDDNYLGAFVEFSGVTRLTDRIDLGLDETFSLTRDSAASDDFYDSIDREKYYINSLSPNVYYDFGNKFGIGLSYLNLWTAYIGEGEDSVQNQGMIDVDYNFTETSRVFLSYEFYSRDYADETSTYTSNRLKLNAEHQFNYFIVNAGAGYHKRSFDEAGLDDIDKFSWNVGLSGQNPPAPEADPKTYMDLTISQDINDAGSGNSYYTATKAELELGHIFIERVETSLSGYVQNSNYEFYQGASSDRDDTTYAVSGLVGYKFLRRGQVNLELGYKNRDSNEEGKSYSDTYGMISLEFGLDLGVM